MILFLKLFQKCFVVVCGVCVFLVCCVFGVVLFVVWIFIVFLVYVQDLVLDDVELQGVFEYVMLDEQKNFFVVLLMSQIVYQVFVVEVVFQCNQLVLVYQIYFVLVCDMCDLCMVQCVIEIVFGVQSLVDVLFVVNLWCQYVLDLNWVL